VVRDDAVHSRPVREQSGSVTQGCDVLEKCMRKLFI
jgi:hypothetical protein